MWISLVFGSPTGAMTPPKNYHNRKAQLLTVSGNWGGWRWPRERVESDRHLLFVAIHGRAFLSLLSVQTFAPVVKSFPPPLLLHRSSSSPSLLHPLIFHPFLHLPSANSISSTLLSFVSWDLYLSSQPYTRATAIMRLPLVGVTISLLSYSVGVAAQTFTDCNPLEKSESLV